MPKIDLGLYFTIDGHIHEIREQLRGNYPYDAEILRERLQELAKGDLNYKTIIRNVPGNTLVPSMEQTFEMNYDLSIEQLFETAQLGTVRWRWQKIASPEEPKTGQRMLRAKVVPLLPGEELEQLEARLGEMEFRMAELEEFLGFLSHEKNLPSTVRLFCGEGIECKRTMSLYPVVATSKRGQRSTAEYAWSAIHWDIRSACLAISEKVE